MCIACSENKPHKLFATSCKNRHCNSILIPSDSKLSSGWVLSASNSNLFASQTFWTPLIPAANIAQVVRSSRLSRQVGRRPLLAWPCQFQKSAPDRLRCHQHSVRIPREIDYPKSKCQTGCSPSSLLFPSRRPPQTFGTPFNLAVRSLSLSLPPASSPTMYSQRTRSSSSSELSPTLSGSTQPNLAPLSARLATNSTRSEADSSPPLRSRYDMICIIMVCMYAVSGSANTADLKCVLKCGLTPCQECKIG